MRTPDDNPLSHGKWGWIESDQSWWCNRGGGQSLEHQFNECKRWRREIHRLWEEVANISGERGARGRAWVRGRCCHRSLTWELHVKNAVFNPKLWYKAIQYGTKPLSHKYSGDPALRRRSPDLQMEEATKIKEQLKGRYAMVGLGPGRRGHEYRYYGSGLLHIPNSIH